MEFVGFHARLAKLREITRTDSCKHAACLNLLATLLVLKETGEGILNIFIGVYIYTYMRIRKALL